MRTPRQSFSASVLTGVLVALTAVPSQTLAQIAIWKAAGAAIKEARRTAKLQIASATTQAQIDGIRAGVTWPAPSTG